MDAAVLVIKVVATWLAVDWISGFVHWFEDSYGRPSLRFVGDRITKPNLRHHFRPRAFVTNSWYSSSELLLFSCMAVLLVAWLIDQLSPMVIVAAVLGANANQVHKWSHRTGAENGVLIVAAQHLKLIQSPRHHHRHHVDGKDSHYCVLTDFLNPILDYCEFWRGLEVVVGVVGLTKRNDDIMLAAVLLDEPDFLDRVR
jgi:ubiquitin-conjugating enzyme E2 variant